MQPAVNGLGVVTVLLALGAVLPHVEGKSIIPVTGSYHGLNYPQLQSRWWNYLLESASRGSLLADVTGDLCAHGQGRDVWFLVGAHSTGEHKHVRRSCSIPAGRSIFLPIINKLRLHDLPATHAGKQLTDASVVRAWIDGEEIWNVRQYFSRSLPFEIPALPASNPFGLPATEAPSMATDEGFYLLFLPLAPGSHKIHVQASGLDSDGPPVDVVYHLNVAAHPRPWAWD